MRIVSQSIALSFIMFGFVLVNKQMPYEIILREALPCFNNAVEKTEVFNQNQNQNVVNEIEEEPMKSENHFQIETSESDIERLRDFEYLKTKFYVADKKTAVTPKDFDVDKFLNTDTKLKIDSEKKDAPKVLIFHTHSTEMYTDSNTDDVYEGVVGLGQRLSQILNDKYNIKTIHHAKRYDVVNGKPNKMGAYERMEPEVSKIIKDNPSLEVAIDIHRDGVADNVKLVETVNGKPTAKIMFVNGLCKILKNNELTQIEGLPNPYLPINLALSFKLQFEASKKYPSIMRKIYVNAYRYSLNMLPKSLLVEVGAQTNTKQEALNSMEILAELLASVI